MLTIPTCHSECKMTFSYRIVFLSLDWIYFCFHLPKYVSRMTTEHLLSMAWQIHRYTLTYRMSLTWDSQLRWETRVWTQKITKIHWLVPHPWHKDQVPLKISPLITSHSWPDVRRQGNTRQLQWMGWCCHAWKLSDERDKMTLHRCFYPLKCFSNPLLSRKFKDYMQSSLFSQ